MYGNVHAALIPDGSFPDRSPLHPERDYSTMKSSTATTVCPAVPWVGVVSIWTPNWLIFDGAQPVVAAGMANVSSCHAGVSPRFTVTTAPPLKMPRKR